MLPILNLDESKYDVKIEGFLEILHNSKTEYEYIDILDEKISL